MYQACETKINQWWKQKKMVYFCIKLLNLTWFTHLCWWSHLSRFTRFWGTSLDHKFLVGGPKSIYTTGVLCLGALTGPRENPLPSPLPQNLTKLFILVCFCQPFGAGTLSFMSGGPYGPRGVLSDFGGGLRGSPWSIIGQTLFWPLPYIKVS